MPGLARERVCKRGEPPPNQMAGKSEKLCPSFENILSAMRNCLFLPAKSETGIYALSRVRDIKPEIRLPLPDSLERSAGRHKTVSGPLRKVFFVHGCFRRCDNRKAVVL